MFRSPRAELTLKPPPYPLVRSVEEVAEGLHVFPLQTWSRDLAITATELSICVPQEDVVYGLMMPVSDNLSFAGRPRTEDNEGTNGAPGNCAR